MLSLIFMFLASFATENCKEVTSSIAKTASLYDRLSICNS
jgi:hypothetical protein